MSIRSVHLCTEEAQRSRCVCDLDQQDTHRQEGLDALDALLTLFLRARPCIFGTCSAWSQCHNQVGFLVRCCSRALYIQVPGEQGNGRHSRSGLIAVGDMRCGAMGMDKYGAPAQGARWVLHLCDVSCVMFVVLTLDIQPEKIHRNPPVVTKQGTLGAAKKNEQLSSRYIRKKKQRALRS